MNTSSPILPKYTSGEIIAALHTLKTLEELEKFYAVIRDNHHLAKTYRHQVKVQYKRRKAILEATASLDKPQPRRLT